MRWLRWPEAAVVVLALAMAAVVLTPASVWKAPKTDLTVSGFDPNVMYASPQGGGAVAGVVQFTKGALAMSAVPGSRPVVDLATSPLSYSVSFYVTVLEAEPDSTPLTLEVFSPYTGYYYDIVFTAAPARQVLLERLHKDALVSLRPLGVYTLGQQYFVSVRVDRVRSELSVSLTTPPGQAKPTNAVYVAGTGPMYSSHLITTGTVAVDSGQSYALSVDARPLAAGQVGMSITWLNHDGHRLDVVGEWAAANGLGPWAGRSLQAVAPRDATEARVELATADGGQALFSDATFQAVGPGSRNLLANGSFLSGAAGWRRADNAAPLQVRSFADRTFAAEVSAAQWAPLFASLRVAVAVRSASTGGLSTVQLSSYRLVVPHQRWEAVALEDLALRYLVAALAVLGLLALGIAGRRRRYVSRAVGFVRRLWDGEPALVLGPKARRWLLAGAVAGVAYLAGNALLSRAGSLNADIIGARVWAYTAGSHGPGSLYFAPNVSSAEAAQWQGLPLQEAAFPYGPVMAYIFWALGLVYRFFLHQPLAGTLDTSLVDYLLRAANAVFAALDALLVYAVLRQGRQPVRRAVVVLVVLAFNPAIWFAGSVWGTTQAISTAFLLGALYLAYRQHLVATWALLLAAAMTRPQNLVPVLLLAAYVLLTQPKARAVQSLAWAVVITFVYLLPLSLAVSPTLPVDVLANVFLLHVGHGNDPWTMPASYGAMSFWPLVTQIVGHASGEARISFQATRVLFGKDSYYNVGNQAAAVFEVALVGAAVLLRHKLRRDGQVTVLLAAGSTGLLMLVTGAPAYYFVLPLCFVAASRPALGARDYWYCLGALSATTFLSEYAMGAYWLDNHLPWGVGIYSPSFGPSRFMATLPRSDLFITACCLVNISVFAVLVYRALRPMRLPASPWHFGAGRSEVNGVGASTSLEAAVRIDGNGAVHHGAPVEAPPVELAPR
jgi:hypothetical protein